MYNLRLTGIKRHETPSLRSGHDEHRDDNPQCAKNSEMQLVRRTTPTAQSLPCEGYNTRSSSTLVEKWKGHAMGNPLLPGAHSRLTSEPALSAVYLLLIYSVPARNPANLSPGAATLGYKEVTRFYRRANFCYDRRSGKLITKNLVHLIEIAKMLV